MSELLISVVIPAKNEEDNIGLCLESVLRQTLPPDAYEVIVADNASSDRTVEIVGVFAHERNNVHLVAFSGGTIAAVRMAGFRRARGKAVAFLDADCVVPPEWLEAGIGLLERDSTASAVGFAPALPRTEDTWVVKTLYSMTSGGRYKGKQAVPWLPSFNLIVRRSYFEMVGGFDESLETCEDADLGYRLGTVSRLLFCETLTVRHLGTSKTVKEFFLKELWRGRSNLAMFIRTPGKSKDLPSVAAPILYVLCLVLAALGFPHMRQNPTGRVLTMGATVVTLALPLCLTLRARVFRPGALIRTTWLYCLYLCARGLAVLRR